MEHFIQGVYRYFALGVSVLALWGRGPDMPESVKRVYTGLPEKIDFNFHVRPILADRCFACHGPDENARKANLRLDIQEGIFTALKGKNTVPVVPGKPKKVS